MNHDNIGNPEEFCSEEEVGGVQDAALHACHEELAQLRDKYTRVRADLDNYSRRIDKERAQWLSAGQAAVLTDLLDVMDDLDRVHKQTDKQEEETTTDGAFLVAFQMIEKALKKVLNKHGVHEIAQTRHFDPVFHEAVMQVESATHEAGQVVQVLAKGYRYKDAVLRPAKVSVAR